MQTQLPDKFHSPHFQPDYRLSYRCTEILEPPLTVRMVLNVPVTDIRKADLRLPRNDCYLVPARMNGLVNACSPTWNARAPQPRDCWWRDDGHRLLSCSERRRLTFRHPRKESCADFCCSRRQSAWSERVDMCRPLVPTRWSWSHFFCRDACRIFVFFVLSRRVKTDPINYYVYFLSMMLAPTF